MATTPVFILLALLAQPAAGQVPSAGDEKAAFLSELESLRKNKPAEFEKGRRVFTLMAELLLGRPGYGVGPFDGIADEKLTEALRTYEKSRRIPVTGNPLSFETVETIRKDLETLDQKPTSLPRRFVYTDQWAAGYVSASGTWVIAGEEQSFPQQTSKFDCDRRNGTCTEVTAILTSDGGGGRLSIDTDTYEIERWDEQEIVTKPLQFGCTRYVKRISRLQKTASGIRSTTKADAGCKGMDLDEKYLKLADGFEVYLGLQEAHNKKWQELTLIQTELPSPPGPSGNRKR